MQRVLSIFMALCIGLTLSLDVHAKRFGGGKSFGSAPSHQTRQAPQQTQAAPNQAGRQTPAAASGASRWLGPLAGLAAGGLLASMFAHIPYHVAQEGRQVCVSFDNRNRLQGWAPKILTPSLV